jgi:hypothetical protein
MTMPFDSEGYRPNALNLTPEIVSVIYDELLPWLDNGGDDWCTFDYNVWEWCGTSACIGGWLETRLFGRTSSQPVWDLYKRLGLPEEVGESLFFEGFDSTTADAAAACVRRLMEVGKVDWARAT